jgi:hypothetical protein
MSILSAIYNTSKLLSGRGLVRGVQPGGIARNGKSRLRHQAIKQKYKLWQCLLSAMPGENYSCHALMGYALALGDARLYPDRLTELFELLAEMQDRHHDS